MRSALGGWAKAEQAAKLHVILDRYFDEADRRRSMLGFDFTNYHRTLSPYLRAYRETGFAIEDIVELTPEAGSSSVFPSSATSSAFPTSSLSFRKTSIGHRVTISSSLTFLDCRSSQLRAVFGPPGQSLGLAPANAPGFASACSERFVVLMRPIFHLRFTVG